MSVKEEYEALNGQRREGRDDIYQEVHIDDSVIDEVDIKGAIDVFKNNHSSIIYFGAAWCPWCRLALPVLIEYAKRNDERISYCDLDHKRPVYKIIDDKITLVDSGDADYPLLINNFKEIMEECVVYDGDKVIKIEGTYNIDLPLTVFGSFGTVKGYHYGAVDLKCGQTPYDLLDKDQIDELLMIFKEKEKTRAMTCSLDGKCE